MCTFRTSRPNFGSLARYLMKSEREMDEYEHYMELREKLIKQGLTFVAATEKAFKETYKKN